MSGLKDYFELDFSRTATVKYELDAVPLKDKSSKSTFYARAHIDFLSQVKYCSFYIPEDLCGNLLVMCRSVLAHTKEILALRGGSEVILPKADKSWSGQGIQLLANEYLDINLVSSLGSIHPVVNFHVAPPVYIYAESNLSEKEMRDITSLGKRYGCDVIIRDRKYAMERLKNDKPIAFISHDSSDKVGVARPIAQGLSQMGFSVWFDEYSLKPGDRLRESIEKGMQECEKCILVLTPNFLNNSGWTSAEFNMIFSREIIEEKSLVIPVWAGVDKKEVFKYSPGLVNVLGVVWSEKDEDRCIREISRGLDTE